jgi:hypothetical protein
MDRAKRSECSIAGLAAARHDTNEKPGTNAGLSI